MQLLDGIKCNDLSVADTGILSGDLYMAKRNTGWHLFECNKTDGISVYPKGIGYPYDCYECFKVIND